MHLSLVIGSQGRAEGRTLPLDSTLKEGTPKVFCGCMLHLCKQYRATGGRLKESVTGCPEAAWRCEGESKRT